MGKKSLPQRLDFSPFLRSLHHSHVQALLEAPPAAPSPAKNRIFGPLWDLQRPPQPLLLRASRRSAAPGAAAALCPRAVEAGTVLGHPWGSHPGSEQPPRPGQPRENDRGTALIHRSPRAALPRGCRPVKAGGKATGSAARGRGQRSQHPLPAAQSEAPEGENHPEGEK